MTYNIRKVKGIYRSKPHINELIHHIAQVSPDILLCQEVAQYHGDQHYQDRLLAKGLATPYFCYEPNVDREHRSHGNATFSKLPIACYQNFNVSTNRIEDRGILLSEITVNGVSIAVFNLHFGLTPLQRRLQARMLEKLVLEHIPAEQPVIIAGDFNDVSGWVDRYFAGRGHLKSALENLSFAERRTWSSRRPLLALDRIYYRGIQVEHVEILKGPPWQDLSDHLPLIMVFSL